METLSGFIRTVCPPIYYVLNPVTAKLLPASITAVYTSLNENCIHNGKNHPLGQCVPLCGSEPHTVGQETHCLLGHLFLACLMKGGPCLSVKV